MLSIPLSSSSRCCFRGRRCDAGLAENRFPSAAGSRPPLSTVACRPVPPPIDSRPRVVLRQRSVQGAQNRGEVEELHACRAVCVVLEGSKSWPACSL
ncbi:Os09g0443400 [Oryza sativa Japonica Group]|uniref:Os09g0443400 protein n=1 Tax=Oryza sativa subsp. japonica TaxID=39947 RepID=A0A0P0XN15_ORYSJ|nr:Os09g0443400 [Oryza sativa Japonica Group]